MHNKRMPIMGFYSQQVRLPSHLIYVFFMFIVQIKELKKQINDIQNEITLRRISNRPCHDLIAEKQKYTEIPRSIRRGRKRPFLIVFDSFGSDRITVVFHRIVNERKRSDTPFSGRLRQLLTVYDTTKNGRNTITTKWAI